MGIEVTNNHIEEALEILEEKKQKIFEEWGLFGEGQAKIYCPVDTGRLRNSISHATEEDGMVIGTNVEYAPYVELGTSRMDPQPFLAPAIENNMDTYESIMKMELQS